MSSKKINLLIPIAGRAQRFIDEGYQMPKPLIMVVDKLMIELAMSSIKWQDCNLIFIVRKDHVYNFSIDTVLKDLFGNDIKVVETEGVTRGALCTCLLAKHLIDSNPLVIYTPDVYFESQFDPYSVDPDTHGLLLTFKANSNAHSYIQIGEDGTAIKTAEKVVISENAAVGVYYFKDGARFIDHGERMVEEEITTNGEFYLCPVYNFFIQDSLDLSSLGGNVIGGSHIKIKEVEKMHVLGTPQELDFYIKNVHPKITDKNIAICCDHSGFDAKEDFKSILDELDISYTDYGCYVNKDCDYADFVSLSVKAIQSNHSDFAFGFCRTGQGINIAANKSLGIRGAIVLDDYTAKYSRKHNCANFFSIPSKYVDKNSMRHILTSLLSESFDGGRHMTRLKKSNIDG